jgi:hypothetical protein
VSKAATPCCWQLFGPAQLRLIWRLFVTRGALTCTNDPCLTELATLRGDDLGLSAHQATELRESCRVVDRVCRTLLSGEQTGLLWGPSAHQATESREDCRAVDRVGRTLLPGEQSAGRERGAPPAPHPLGPKCTTNLAEAVPAGTANR